MSTLRFLTGGLAALALVGCTSGDTGTLQLNLTDAPSDLDGAATIPITIDEVRVHVGDGDALDTDTADTDASDTDGVDDDASGWTTVCGDPATFDLLTLTNGATAPMCPEATIPAGRITQIRLVVSAGEVTWDDARPATTLEIPSDVVRIVTPGVTLPAGGHLDLLLDFDAAQSIHAADGKLILRPTIQVVR